METIVPFGREISVRQVPLAVLCDKVFLNRCMRYNYHSVTQSPTPKSLSCLIFLVRYRYVGHLFPSSYFPQWPHSFQTPNTVTFSECFDDTLNLVPRVLSLLRESTLVAAGLVSARFLQIPEM